MTFLFRLTLCCFVFVLFGPSGRLPLALGSKPSSSPSPKVPSQSQIRYKSVQPGDSVYSLLQSAGFNEQQVQTVLSKSILPRDFQLSTGERYRVLKNPSQKLVELRFFDSMEDLTYQFRRYGKEKASATAEPGQYRIITESTSGTVNGSLIASIKSQVNDTQLAYQFLNAYLPEYPRLTRLLQRGSTFHFTYQKKYDGVHFVRYGQILNTELEVLDKLVRRIFVHHKNGGVFIDPASPQLEKPFYAPVDSLHISSLFNPRRRHPITKRRQPHYGVDFELPRGANVYTSYSGRVVRLGRNRAAGYFVVLRHENGVETFYNHLKEISPQIKKDLFVTNGQVIGKVGCTGYCTKPHLHFSLKKRGKYLDPLPFIKSYPFHLRGIVERKLAQYKGHEVGL